MDEASPAHQSDDPSERTVGEYLRHQGYGSVVHHPDGQNDPPDFAIDGRIAVEVRRLDQNVDTPDGPRSIDHTGKPFQALFDRALASMGPPVTGVSWFVNYTIRRRPLPPWKTLQRALLSRLRDFADGSITEGVDVALTDSVTIDFLRASKAHPTMFLRGSSTDHDAGGFVVEDLFTNLRICLDEKTRKVQRVLHRYPEWWLAVVDLIDYGGLDEQDRADLRALIRPQEPWKKVIVVSPLDPRIGFEL
jgi:hypothetical protein